jgi:excisionase family DNA binding protein
MDKINSKETAPETKKIEAPAAGKSNRMLAVRHVAQMLGVHESTVRMWADSGILESYRLGPRQDRRIPLESIMHTLEAAKNWPHYGPTNKNQPENVTADTPNHISQA